MLSLRIALRYLLSRKQFGAVNVISAISVVAVAVATAAIVIVLSVFNGFEQLAESKLSAIDPDYLLVPQRGKSVGNVEALTDRIELIGGVDLAAPQIVEQAYAVAPGGQMAVRLMGLTPQALQHCGLSRVVVDGIGVLPSDSSALLSAGVAMSLGIRPYAGIDEFSVYEPRRIGAINPANPAMGFRREEFRCEGVFQIEQEEYDRDMVVINYDEAARLLLYSDAATSIAVYSSANVSIDIKALNMVAKDAGLIVKDRYEQQEQTYRMIAIEKWISFLMLAFILIIASANIISTLSMLVLDKAVNMSILSAMGATKGFIRRIFATQGWLIVVLGGMAGLIIGVVLVLGQMKYGWIKLGASNPELMSITNYPVVLRIEDVVLTFVALVGVALLLTPVVGMVVRDSSHREQ